MDAGNESTPPTRSYLPEALFFGGVTSMSLMLGFSTTLVMAKKKDPGYFDKGLIKSKVLPESGGALALRALGWGSLYAVSGVGILCFGIWKLLGVKTMEDFRSKMQRNLPTVPKPESQGRTEFASIREFVNWVLDEDDRKKSER